VLKKAYDENKQERDCLVHFLRLLQCVSQAHKVRETNTLLLATSPNIHRFKIFFTHSAINLS